MAILAVVPVAAALLVAVANAQSAPAWDLIPKACATDCAATIQSSCVNNSHPVDSSH